MDEKKIKLQNIKCPHCSATVKRELSGIQGIEKVEVDVETSTLTVSYSEPANWETIKTVLSEIGHPPEE